MRRKRSKRKDRKPVPDLSILELAAVLEQIAAMKALPLVPTTQKEAPMRDLNDDVRQVLD